MADIYRDALGIPHVRASTLRDLAEAQGEVTARDRGWQIEVDRLRAAGRLAELIGEAGVAWDVFARRARLDDTARRAYHGLGDESQAFVRDYTVGVRRGMDAVGHRAAEFRALDELFGNTRPLTPWEEHDPLGVLHVAHALFSTFPMVLWREHVSTTLGDEWVETFGGFGSGDAGDETAPTAGSNAWALHGSRTASGMPLLGGDPHRLFELPGVYQQIRLACDEFDVIGLAFPGVPGVPHFGHTGDAAWGITNAMAHSSEVFRERLRISGDGYEALGPNGWQPVNVERTVVRVRGGADIEVEALETEHGCVITDLRPDGEELRAWSIRFPARTNGDLGGAALLPLLRARSADDVMSAFGSWVDPVNRVLAADRHGTVLSATVGTVPERPRSARCLPLDAACVEVAADRSPAPAITVLDVAVDANERPTRESIDYAWAYPSRHRAARIAALIDDLAPRTTADFRAIWGDTASGSPAALRALLPAGELPPAAAHVRDVLVNWDGRMDADSQAAGLFAAWRAALVRALAQHPVLRPLAAPHGFGDILDPWLRIEGQIAAALPSVLRHRALQDDAAALVIAALAAASDAPQWGTTHRMLPLHVLADVPGAVVPGVGLDIELSGDGDCVRSTGSTPGLTDRSWRGSVARWAWDLADRTNSLWGVPFGAAGAAESAHFADQLATWGEAGATRVVTDWDQLHFDRATDAAARLATGAPGTTVFATESSALGHITVTVLDPVGDLGLIHEWVTRPTARFWGLGDRTPEELRDLYLFVDGLPSHHAFLVRRDGLPIVLLQTYEPENDPLGEVYEVQPGDVGIHFFLGDRGAPVPGFTSLVGDVIAEFLFASPAAERIVVEPDIGNERAVARLRKSGFTLGPEVDLPGKTGQLAFVTRAQWERRRSG